MKMLLANALMTDSIFYIKVSEYLFFIEIEKYCLFLNETMEKLYLNFHFKFHDFFP